MTNSEQELVEYFIIRDLDYDGMYIQRVATKEEAEKRYEEIQQEITKWIEKYGEKTADKGIALIEGKILKKEDIDFDY